VWRFVHFLVLTLLATTAAASGSDFQASLPDAPSAVLAQRFHGPAEDASKTQPRPSDAASADPASPQDANRSSLLRRAIWDQKGIYTAPFHRRNVKWDLLFLAATGGLIAGDKHISGALSPDHADVSQHISDVGMYSMTASVAGLWLSSLKSHDAHARETGVLAAEAFANSAALYGLTQFVAGRERPTEGSGNGRFWQNNALGSSFPSWHSTFTWTMASVVAHEYPKPWVRWLVYGTATTVSVTRVTGLEHFPSDVAVGGTFGYLIGQQIFKAHCAAGLSSGCRSSRKSVQGKRQKQGQ
jgi:membrane-associated phospholipid phosphatase